MYQGWIQAMGKGDGTGGHKPQIDSKCWNYKTLQSFDGEGGGGSLQDFFFFFSI